MNRCLYKTFDPDSCTKIILYLCRMSVKYLLLVLLSSAGLAANSQKLIRISGKITDEQSIPVSGASVSILNTHLGALSNKQGEFEIENLPAGNYYLRISAIGFAEINRPVGESNATGISIVLSRSSVHLDEVVVSAQKREELLQSLPFSISALSSRKTEDYRIWDTRDISVIVPSLYAGNPGDGRNVTSVRGVTSTSYDPAVATYIDGVNQFNLDTYIPQLFDIERIEVLRGPQGTLYGRNAMGGVINIITKKPSNKLSGFANVNIGNFGRQRYAAGLKGAILPGKLYAGGALLYDRSNGYYTNEYNNSDFDKKYALTGNYYLTWAASSRLGITLNAKHNIHRNHGPFTLINGVDAAFENPFKLNQNATSKMIDNTFNSSLSINYTGSRLIFTSQTAWQSNLRYYEDPLDGDFSPIDGVTIINNYGGKWNRVKALTQEFRLSSPASVSSPLKWTTGLYFFHQSVPNKQATHFGEDADLLGSPDENFSIINTATGKSTGGAIYGQLTYSITKKLDLTVGLRYDHEEKKQSVLGEYQVDPDPNPVFEIRPDTSATADFNAFSPRVSLAYQFSPATNGYITYSRGFRAGGFTQLSSDPSQPPLHSYKPEYSSSYEAGVKNSLLGNRLFLNLAVFYTRISDAQVPTLILPDAITVTRNAGKLDSKGVELEIASKPARGLEIDYNFGYTDAEYKTLKISQNGTEQDFKGNKQVFTPEITSSLAAQYGIDLSKRQNLKAVIRGEWQALGEHYFDLANMIRQEGYSLFNTRFGVSADNWEVFGWVRNIADKRFIAYAYDFGAVHLGNPRTFGITITGKF
jgi:iron complex outermembrane recepter protein